MIFTCRINKNECDKMFHQCMEDKCKSVNLFKRSFCCTTAHIFNLLVNLTGDDIFYKSQARACVCD
jgi:hypothetical protein